MKDVMSMMVIPRVKIKAMALIAALAFCSAFAEEASVKGVCWRYSVVHGAARLDLLNQIFTGKFVVPDKGVK